MTNVDFEGSARSMGCIKGSKYDVLASGPRQMIDFEARILARSEYVKRKLGLQFELPLSTLYFRGPIAFLFDLGLDPFTYLPYLPFYSDFVFWKKHVLKKCVLVCAPAEWLTQVTGIEQNPECIAENAVLTEDGRSMFFQGAQ